MRVLILSSFEVAWEFDSRSIGHTPPPSDSPIRQILPDRPTQTGEMVMTADGNNGNILLGEYWDFDSIKNMIYK